MPALEIKATSSDPKGNFNKAVGMVDDAAEAGGKCAKFQCHIVDDEMIPNSLVPGNAKESTWDIFCRSFATKIARGCCSLQFLVLFLMVGFVALRVAAAGHDVPHVPIASLGAGPSFALADFDSDKRLDLANC